MSLPKDCAEFLTKNNLSHHEEFFYNLGVASFDDFFAIESLDVKSFLKPLEERRLFKALSGFNSEINKKQKNRHQLPDFEDCERTDVKEEECHEQQIGAEGGSELLQDNLEECIATPIPSTSNKTKEQSTEHQEFEIKNHGLQMPIVFGKKNTYGNAAEKGIKLWTDFQIKSAIGLEKKRREFFNMKAEELCSVKHIRHNWTKTEIAGAADTAWTLKKTALLKKERRPPSKRSLPIRKNLEEMMTNHIKLESLDKEVKACAEEGDLDREKEVEEEMRHIMRKLKNAQEALRKALQERLCQLGEEKSKINKDFEQMPLSVEIQDFLKDLPEEGNDSDLDFEPLCKKNKDE
ncbi:Hypothetical predicted protein [Mytilus galloprovincialis]|uniref:SAM domain-containing protein n=1 Tax=Mytilus galloprovincialis TaxID=29158 RepID=A0A8B6G8S2_MYTGA|nr:Hypothetical predicted protein [Mytilus galloprovincialis]